MGGGAKSCPDKLRTERKGLMGLGGRKAPNRQRHRGGMSSLRLRRNPRKISRSKGKKKFSQPAECLSGRCENFNAVDQEGGEIRGSGEGKLEIVDAKKKNPEAGGI